MMVLIAFNRARQKSFPQLGLLFIHQQPSLFISASSWPLLRFAFLWQTFQLHCTPRGSNCQLWIQIGSTSSQGRQEKSCREVGLCGTGHVPSMYILFLSQDYFSVVERGGRYCGASPSWPWRTLGWGREAWKRGCRRKPSALWRNYDKWEVNPVACP